MKTVQLIARILVLIGLQIVFFNRLVLYDFGFIFIYLYAIFTLPLNWKPWQILLSSFTIGLLIDIFAGTYGLHMISATFLGFIRLPILRLFVRNLVNPQGEMLDINELPASSFFLYSLVGTLCFCIVFFLVDYFSIVALVRLAITIGLSTVATGICLFIYRLLFAYKINTN